MTCIAYRAGVIAGDGIMEIGNIKSRCVKVAKRRGHLFGAAGDECPPLLDLMEAFFEPDEENIRTMRQFKKWDALIVTPAGELQVWCEAWSFETIIAPFYAIGSGDQGAMCAMEMGATAVQAVRAACKWVPGIGGPISARRLKS